MRKSDSNAWGKNNPDAKRTASREAMQRYRGRDPAAHLWREAKRRAEKNGLEFSIEIVDIHVPDVCPIFGTELVTGGSRETLDDAPALDRIENHKGYVRGNIWVISHRANSAKRDLSIQEFCHMADVLKDLRCASFSIWRPVAELTLRSPGPEDTPLILQHKLP
jgi:hypothetical protein